MGKSTISVAIFNSVLFIYQKVNHRTKWGKVQLATFDDQLDILPLPCLIFRRVVAFVRS
jgi:hypothetical protein